MERLNADQLVVDRAKNLVTGWILASPADGGMLISWSPTSIEHNYIFPFKFDSLLMV
jgi:hypothetical protein